MAHDLLKFGLTLAVIAIVAIAIALLVSNYLTAYKTGDRGMKNHTSAALGGKGARKAVPSPTPEPYNMTLPGPYYPRPSQYPPTVAVQPPVQMQPVMPQRVERPAERPTPMPEPSATPEPRIIAAPPVPNAPYMEGWHFIQQLYWIIAIISRQCYAFPPWPIFWWP